ncbi:glycosyltransferase 87 family protein [Corynebacterium sp. 335C]
MLLDWIRDLPAGRRRLLYGVLGLFSAVMVAQFVHQAFTYYMMDVEVFQDAGWALRRGQDLYSDDFPTRSGYRFIYPPFAALLFAPMTWAGPVTLQVLWTLSTIAAVYLILFMVLRRLRVPQAWGWAALLLGLALRIDPITENVSFGQINVFLALLIVADVLGFLPRQLRGLGIGVAAGIKITPAAYALIFLVRGRWGDVARSFGWFVVTVVIGAIIRPQESLYFWTDEFFATNRGGDAAYEANQALSGLLARAGVEGALLQVLIYAAFVAGAVAAGVAAWKLEKAGRPVLALLTVALAVCAIGPYTVSHHWSIVVLGLPLLLTLRAPWAMGLAVALWAALTLSPYTLFAPDAMGPPTQWATGRPELWLLGNLHGLVGLLVFVVLAAAAIRGHAPREAWREGEPRDDGAGSPSAPEAARA